MFGLKRNKALEDQKFLCLDVGTEFLKLIVYSVRGDSIVIQEYVKTRQHAAAMKSGTITSIRRVIETVQETMSTLNVKEFDGAIMGIAGELVKGVMVEARYDRTNADKQIDRDEIDVVAQKITEEAYREAQNLVFSHIGDTTGELKNVEMLNYVVVDAVIDGFRVEEPVGMCGKEAKIKLYFTFAPIVHVNYLKTITDSIGVKLLGIVPQPFAIARAVNGSRESNYSSIIIDVGGGTTDIAIIQNGVVIGTPMVAFGGRVFTKRIANDLRISVDEAEEFKIKYTNKDLIVNRVAEVHDSIIKDAPLWATVVYVGLKELEEVVNGFPYKMFLCGGGSLLPEMKEALIEFPWKKELPFNRSPLITYLNPQDLYGIIDESNLLKSSEDVTPASIAKFTTEILDR
jgi:cell division protein FtsA